MRLKRTEHARPDFAQRYTLIRANTAPPAAGVIADEIVELKQVVASLRRLRELDWNTLDRRTGFRWEAIEQLKAPNGAKLYSLRLSQRIRAVGFREGDFLRLISLHPGHDSAYDR